MRPSVLTVCLFFKFVASAVVDSSADSPYCCPDGSVSVVKVVTVNKAVKFTTTATIKTIVGYREAHDCQGVASYLVKRSYWADRYRGDWKLKSCPIYKEVTTPVTQYRTEKWEKPEYSMACAADELVCCAGYHKAKNGECRSEAELELMEDENVKKVLDFLG